MQNLNLEYITKRFPGVTALHDVSLQVARGEIHGLCGENGAGKSTLMNILAGNLQPDTGSIRIDGIEVFFETPKEAFAKSIAIVYQHLSLVDSLSVAENIFANEQPVNKWGIIQFGSLLEKTRLLLEQLDIGDIPGDRLVSQLSPAEKQMVEIAKALSRQPSIFILDEPTASLTTKETGKLFHILKKLKKNGVAIIYISHRLEELFELADRISVLKDGKYQGTFNVGEITKDELITRMVGRELHITKGTSSKSNEVLLKVENITGPKFTNVSFDIHRGEIVGLAGLVGAGRTEIARAIFGSDKLHSGRILFKGRPFRATHSSTAINAGIAYLSEDRRTDGLFHEMTVTDNVVIASLPRTMPSGFYNKLRAAQLATGSKEKLRIAASDIFQRAGTLSGGNQQKVMLAKWLHTDPDLLIIDEPTHGVDVGAKYEIYNILKSLAAQGKGILMISSELPELTGLCDRIIVVKKGSIAGELTDEKMTEENVIRLAT